MTLLEVCLDDVDGAIIADQRGADRIELCTGLADGGTTPSIGTVATVLRSVQRIGVQLLVRQRGGDFVYSRTELDAMCADIEAFRALAAAPGVDGGTGGVTVGFVLGALTPDGAVDVSAMERLLAATGSAPVTFHKAIDVTSDLRESLRAVIDLGIGRILTSGGQPSAVAGSDMIADLVQRSAGRVQIMAAGGIRPDNVAGIIARTGVPEVHLRAATPVASANRRGADALGYDSGCRMATSGTIIDGMLQAIASDGPTQ